MRAGSARGKSESGFGEFGEPLSLTLLRGKKKHNAKVADFPVCTSADWLRGKATV